MTGDDCPPWTCSTLPPPARTGAYTAESSAQGLLQIAFFQEAHPSNKWRRAQKSSQGCSGMTGSREINFHSRYSTSKCVPLKKLIYLKTSAAVAPPHGFLSPTLQKKNAHPTHPGFPWAALFPVVKTSEAPKERAILKHWFTCEKMRDPVYFLIHHVIFFQAFAFYKIGGEPSPDW